MRNLGKFLGVSFLFLPLCAWGQFWISEIHYNPEGSDSGFEWIEIWNSAQDDRSLQGYVLRENEVNHRLSQEKDMWMVPAGRRVVIVDNPAKFKQKIPQYQGVIIDSAFSLSNSGEMLQLINPHEQIEFQVSYSPETGGNGNGNTIGLIGDIWQETVLSPGAVNQSVPDSVPVDNDPPDDEKTTAPRTGLNQPGADVKVDVSPATYIEIKNPDYKEQVIKVDAGDDRTVMAGVSYWFSGRVFGLAGGEIQKDPQVWWNWGDGSSGTGPMDRHRYLYPGEYTITMGATVLGSSARDRLRVTVIPPALGLVMRDTDDGLIVGVHNTSAYGLEISHNILSNGAQEFVFPEATFVNAGQTVWLDNKITGLVLDKTTTVSLYDATHHQIDSQSVLEYVLQQQVAQLQHSTEVEKQTDQAVDQVQGATDDENSEQSKPFTEPTHSQVFIYDMPVEGSEEVPMDIHVQEQGQSMHVPETTNPEPAQSAQIISAVESGNTVGVNWHTWAMLALVVTAGGLYAREHHKNKSTSISGIEIID